MDLFTRLFGNLLVLVYHCFDRIVIHGYLSGLSRPEQVVHFVRQVHGIPVVSKEVLSQRTHDYQTWVEAFARNHQIPMEWAEKGLRKEDYVLPALRRREKQNAYGVYFIFKSMEQGGHFVSACRSSRRKTPTTASWRTSAAALRITIFISGMKFWARSLCAWRVSFRFTPPTG